MKREVIALEEVAADPTNCYQITVHGDVAIEELTIYGDGGAEWTYIKYKNGSSCSGEPANWHSYVRITDDHTPKKRFNKLTLFADVNSRPEDFERDDSDNLLVDCRTCGHTIPVPVTNAQLLDWGCGGLIQNVMPDLDITLRELLISATCGPCFDALFADAD